MAGSHRTLRVAAVLLAFGVSAGAFANGAMGLGLEIFDMKVWAVYVAVTIIYEAWLIGRWLQFSWLGSLALSLSANAVTALCCPQLGAVFLHSNTLNPNPLGYTVKMLFVFGVISALIEAVIWGFAKQRVSPEYVSKGLLPRVLWVHLLGVPLSVVVLLAPVRPYRGIETMARVWRFSGLHSMLYRFAELTGEEGRLPKAESLEQLLRPLFRDKDDWVVAYAPEYHRFDTGEMRRRPLLLNKDVLGIKLGEGQPSKPVWFIRDPDGRFGWTIDLTTGQVERDVKLGF